MNYNNDTIDEFHPLNYDLISRYPRHRLYADNAGCLLELRTHSVKRFMGEVTGRCGIILGMTHSWDGGSQTQTLFLDASGGIYSISQYSGLTQVNIDIMLLYMLLNPIEQLDGWVLQDIKQAKIEHAHKTHPMIGIKSSWGKTETFHPHLQKAIQEGESVILKNRL